MIRERLAEVFAALEHAEFCRFVPGDKLAEAKVLTFSELDSLSRLIGSAMRRQGLRAGDQVIIILGHHFHAMSAFVGALRTSILPSFMAPLSEKQDPTLFWSGLKEMLQRQFGGAVVTTSDLVATIQALSPNSRVLSIDSLTTGPMAGADVVDHAHGADGSEPAFIQYSSGTTGLKKGVVISHQALINQVDAYTGCLELSRQDRIVSWLPLYHDMGLIACFLLPLLRGVPLVLMDPLIWVRQPHLLMEAIATHEATLCWLPNFAFHHLCRTIPEPENFDLSSMRAFISCSEPAKAETFDEFRRHFDVSGLAPDGLQVCYAMAETVFAITQSPLKQTTRVIDVDRERLQQSGEVYTVMEDDAPRQAFLSTGVSIDGTVAEIVGSDLGVLSEGRVGEIRVRSDTLFGGYHHAPDDTDEVLSGEGFRTGDMGFLYEGELYVTGRIKDVIIVHGRNYYAHDIEMLVNRCPGVISGRCVALGMYDPISASESVVVIAESRCPPDEQGELSRMIKDHVLSGLDLTIQRAKIVPPRWLVKTTSGKISRKENAIKLTDELERRSA